MHKKFAERVVKILRDKKIKEGTPAATEYVKRVCHGAEPEVWDILKEAQAKAAGWNMEPKKP